MENLVNFSGRASVDEAGLPDSITPLWNSGYKQEDLHDQKANR
jgi:hypothetical protein